MKIISPLTVAGKNPRYFSDSNGEPVFLTGSHTWNNLVDMGPKCAVVPFDWNGYLDFLADSHHNFVRLWAFNSLATWNPRDEVLGAPWERSGPAAAADGRPRLDLTRLDERYFDRLRERVASAGARGVYVSVMLFENWTNYRQNSAPLTHHMFAAGNNVNGVDILPTERHGVLAGWCMMHDPEVLAIQKAYIRMVVETVGDFDNVLYEICNEGGAQSHAWQEHLTQYVRALEAGRAKRHPIGQTGGMGASNRLLHQSSADWIAPDARPIEGMAEGYLTGHYTFGSGPFETGDRPILLDTDHLWGVGGDVAWAWRSFCRGYNLIYMDPWNDQPSGFFVHPRWPDPADPAVRRELGAIRRFSERIDLAASTPLNDCASAGYCIGVPGAEYLAFNPAPSVLTLDVPAGEWRVTWHNPTTGRTHDPQEQVFSASGARRLAAPFEGPSVVLVERSG